MKRLPVTIAFGALALIIAAVPANANLLVNGGFEDGDFTGWTADANSFPMYVGSSQPVEEGSYSAQIAGYSYDPDTLSQTVGDTFGKLYTLSFWVYQTPGGSCPAECLDAYWNGALVAAQNTSTGNSWVEFTVNVTGTGSDTLEFADANDPGYTFLDNVQLNSASSVPEPGTFALFGMALLGLGGLRLRRKFV